MAKKTTVLVVDADSHAVRLLRRLLEGEGYAVVAAGDGATALDAFCENEIDLVLSEVALPGTDGRELCRRIREFSGVPFIFVSRQDGEEARVAGLDAGADDYVSKPFSGREVAARARAALRRSQSAGQPVPAAFRTNGLEIDFARRRVTLGGMEIGLTATEYQILSCLARHPSAVVTPDQILERVWGETYRGESNILQVNMARLRQKLKDDARQPKYIVTRHGMGYSMAAAPAG